MKPLKKLWPYIRPYKTKAILVFILGLVMAVTTVGLIPLVKKLFDEVFMSKNTVLLYQIPILIIGLRFVNGIARFFHLYLLKNIGERIAAKIRQDLQEKFMALNLNFHNKFATGGGGLLSRTINDVTVVQWGLHIMADMVREPVTAILLTVVILQLDWKLTLFSMTVAPIIGWALKQLARSVRKYSYPQQEVLEHITSNLKESLDGVRVIQSFNLEKEMKNRMNTVMETYLENRRKIIAREEAGGPISEFLAAVVVALIVYYLGVEIAANRSTPGTAMGFITALTLFQQPFRKIQDAYLRLQQTVAATERLFQILEDPNVVPETMGQQPFPKNWNEIEFKNVTFAYEQNNVLKNVNLTVRRGEVIALVGESGSGKSTLVNLLERFFDASTGEIRIGGVPIEAIPLKELRKNIALVTQDVFLFNDTIQKNIQSGDFEKAGKSVEDSAMAANAHDFIVRLPEGYETRVGERGARVSGGERQRISIARALYKDAPILILDEATSALDSASEVEVQKGIDRLLEGRTALVIAHRLSTVVKADRILVLKNGQIVEEGTHSTLIHQNGAYAHFYQLQTKL